MLSPPLEILRSALRRAGEKDVDGAIALLVEGVELCRREREHLGQLPRLSINLGMFYRRRERYGEAIGLMRQSLVLCPGDRSILHSLSDLLLQAGDVAGAASAAAELRLVCESNPEAFTADWGEALSMLENRIAVLGGSKLPLQR